MLFPLLPLPDPLHRIIYVVVTVIFVVVVVLVLCQFLLALAGVVHWQPLLFRR